MWRAVAQGTGASHTGNEPPASLKAPHGAAPEQPGPQLGAGAALQKTAEL